MKVVQLPRLPLNDLRAVDAHERQLSTPRARSYSVTDYERVRFNSDLFRTRTATLRQDGFYLTQVRARTKWGFKREVRRAIAADASYFEPKFTPLQFKVIT